MVLYRIVALSAMENIEEQMMADTAGVTMVNMFIRMLSTYMMTGRVEIMPEVAVNIYRIKILLAAVVEAQVLELLKLELDLDRSHQLTIPKVLKIMHKEPQPRQFRKMEMVQVLVQMQEYQQTQTLTEENQTLIVI